jgi:hypothetical protein
VCLGLLFVLQKRLRGGNDRVTGKYRSRRYRVKPKPRRMSKQESKQSVQGPWMRAVASHAASCWAHDVADALLHNPPYAQARPKDTGMNIAEQ